MYDYLCNPQAQEFIISFVIQIALDHYHVVSTWLVFILIGLLFGISSSSWRLGDNFV